MSALAVGLVAVWAVSAIVLIASGRPRLGCVVLGATAVGAVATWGAQHDDGIGAMVAALVPGAVGVVALSLPDGRLGRSSRALFAVLIGVVAATVGFAYVLADRVPSAAEVAAGCALVIALVAPAVRRRSSSLDPGERPRLQLVAAAVGFLAAVILVGGSLALLADSDAAANVVWASTTVLAMALVAGCSARIRRVAGQVVAAAAATFALAAVMVLGQLFAVLIAGRLPDDDERSLLGPSFAAAGLAAVAIVPARRAAASFSNRWVLGARRPPGDAGRTLTQRASEGVPVDELLLQLVETLRDSLAARSVEVWVRPGTVFELAASVPDRPAGTIECAPAELRALTGASVVGDAWLGLWVPRLRSDYEGLQQRVVPAVHTGAVLGLLRVARDGESPFSEVDDRALAEIGRRLGEVLHARRLDAALTTTLDDLRASRSRLVAAADAERRRIERNLHDGAQQHLVALAVSLRLARDLVHEDPDTSVELLAQLGDDVRDTIQQLRDLAHGIYPPLLVDAGLRDALRAAAQRTPLPVTLDVDARRYPTEVEAAVYFCCLEALQNATKHAPDSSIDVRVWDDDGTLRFVVADDGPGFDWPQTTAGHGFQNMADRLGAIGGRITWDTSPGRGTRVVGEVTP